MSSIDRILEPVPIPRFVTVRQHFERHSIIDVYNNVRLEIRRMENLCSLKKGMRVAITVGSRGIQNLPDIVRAIIDELRAWGMLPFIIPAMGSHGGATAEGQEAVLKELGISEESIGAPIISSMETIKIGTSSNGLPVYVDAVAWKADAIVIFNRVKPHIAFRGKTESGILKMIAIGLGKQYGAQICHHLGFGKMEENIHSIAEYVLSKNKIAFGLSVWENAYHETAGVLALTPKEFIFEEPKLLIEARRIQPQLLIKRLDSLIMDEIGKNISGSGFDTNVVGRFYTPFVPRLETDPTITRLAALDLTKESHGNANGVGIVDFISQRLSKKIDFEQMYPNSLTSTVPIPVKIPLTLKNDMLVYKASIRTSNIVDYQDVRMCRIKNTQEIETIQLSENLLDEIKDNPKLEIVEESPKYLSFNAEGNLF